MNLLKVQFPLVWSRLKEIKKNLNTELIKMVPSGDGFPNLLLDIESPQHIHNEHNPVLEANDVIEQHGDPEEYSDVLFYGLGLGYHLNSFINKYPGVVFSIYEPVPEVFFQLLSYVDLADLPLSSIKYIFIEGKPDDALTFSHEFVNQTRDSVLIIDFPFYQQFFKEKYDNFFKQFEFVINERKSAVNVTAAFEKRWTLNSMLNFDKVLATPNIISEKREHFKDQPAVLVAAGPSLEEEIENIRYIKENGLAYILSAGSAVNTLIKYDLHPHAACTYDPSPKNQLVFKKLLDNKINDIPLIFGSSVGYETLSQYPGPKFHMLTKPDKVSPFYLKSKCGNELETINDAPSISVIALQLLKHLGFNPIILVGQNLAYKDNKQHAEGLDYSRAVIDEKVLDNALEIEDVFGNKIYSNPSFNRMRMQMEYYIMQYNETKIINATRGGAKIEGTEFKPLDEVIKDILHDKIADESWLANLEGFNYDFNHLIEQHISINQAFEKMHILIKKLNYLLFKINKQAENIDFRKMDHIFTALETVYNQLKQNEFFSTFIMPMNQVADQILQRAIININIEKDNHKKANMTVSEFEAYIYSCENDIEMITPVFQQLNNGIEDFVKDYIKRKASNIKVLLISQGILSDGVLYCPAEGSAYIRLNRRDILSMKLLQQHGIKNVFISNNNMKITENVFEQLDVEYLIIDEDNKVQEIEKICLKLNIGYHEIACIIDDANDLDLLEYSSLSFGVKDAVDEVTNQVDYLCTLKGGEGILREAAQVLLMNNFPIQKTIIRTL